MRKPHRSITSRFNRAASVLFLVVGVGYLSTSCGTAPSENKAQPQVQRYSLKGKVISIDKATREVLVDHEAIPGFMGAMQMPYPVADAKTLDQIAPGDEIRADLVVTDGRPALDKVIVTKKASSSSGPSGGR